MARPKSDSAPTSIRLPPEVQEAIAEVGRRFGLDRASVIKAGVLLLKETLDRASVKDAIPAIESARKPRAKSPKGG